MISLLLATALAQCPNGQCGLTVRWAKHVYVAPVPPQAPPVAGDVKPAASAPAFVVVETRGPVKRLGARLFGKRKSCS